MNKDVSLYNLIGRNKDDYTEKQFNEAYDACRVFVAMSGRGKRRKRILNTPWYSVKRAGILDRLRYDFDKGKAYYICGQEWDSEMSILRDLFD